MGSDAFFLPAVLALGIVSTLQDFRVRRISNLWIILSLIYALGIHVILFVSADKQEVFWWVHNIVNVLASAMVAIYFWKQNWWGGGDAKLFICYSALIPLSHYPFGYFSYYFAAFLLLIMTFVPAAIWTFIHAQFNLIKAGKGIAYKYRPERVAEFFQLSVGFTAILFISNLLTLMLSRNFHWIMDFPLIIWLLGIGFYRVIFRLFQKRLWLACISWALAICIVTFFPFAGHLGVCTILMRSFVSWGLIFIFRLYIFRTIERYVEFSKNNNMAFAGWMFLGAVVIWYFKTVPWVMNWLHLK